MLLHPIIRWIGRRAIRWYYRDVQIVGAENIPASGPVLLVASHGNDLPDILLTLTITNRDVLFVANIAASNFILARWTYTGLGVIPVARTRDARGMKARGQDAAALNARAFVKVTEALKAGHVVAIFPEGNVNELPHLAPLRTGAARMALDAVADGVHQLALVPIGYQYEQQEVPRSGLLAVVGKPVRVASWQPVSGERAVSEFTALIRGLLQPLTRTAATWDDIAHVNRIAAATGAVMSSPQQSPIVWADIVHRMVTRARDGTSRALGERDGRSGSEPERADSLASELQRADTFASALQRVDAFASELATFVNDFGGQAWSAADCAIVLRAAGAGASAGQLPSLVLLLALAPLAVVGWLWHAVPFWICHTLGNRLAPGRVDIAAMTLLPGLYVMEAWYAVIPALIWLAGLNSVFVLIIFLTQPRLGDLAMSWRDNVRTWRLHWRVRRAPAATLQRVRMLAGELRQAWQDFEQSFTSSAASR